jgi:histidinol-phosphate aminotransferase
MGEFNNQVAAVGRRSFLRGAALAAAAPIITEAVLAQTSLGSAKAWTRPAIPADAVLINANENPLGPSKNACEAIAKIAPMGGRYDQIGVQDQFVQAFAAKHGLKPEYIAVYPGSSEPLHYTVLAFTSPKRGLVTADPSYEAPTYAAKVTGAPVHKVALTADCAHDIKAMVAADPAAGVIYICNPNNPTGTITARQDILWALDNKPAGSILLVDEAYIHLSDEADVLDMVAAGKDLIVLRTFSKVYGMAGIRCGVALARPDLLARLMAYGQNAMPVTALAAAHASLIDTDLVPTRKAIIGDIRRDTISWLKAGGYKVMGDSHSNCFMVDTGRPGNSVITAMQAKNVYIGRIWPIWPTAVRITVGSATDMARFKIAFKSVMDGPAVAMADPRPGVRAQAGRGGSTLLS